VFRLTKCASEPRADPSSPGIPNARLAQRIVRERFVQDPEDHPDMLSSFIRHGLSTKQCESEILAQLVAGSDTTANYLRVTLVLLATTPHVYTKLRAELDQASAEGRISNPITLAEARKLPYLEVSHRAVQPDVDAQHVYLHSVTVLGVRLGGPPLPAACVDALSPHRAQWR
jgi:cytochrome P450